MFETLQESGVPKTLVTIIGGGLAGCEAAFQLAEAGFRVRLHEMKPRKRSPAHQLDTLGELCCSNSLRSDSGETAVGLLHAELRAFRSLVIGMADRCRVPAGEALAVDRHEFSRAITEAIRSHPRIELVTEEVTRLPEPDEGGAVLLATGPLTSDPLAADLARRCGEGLYFYDAIAPIVAGETIDFEVAFRASRWGKGGGDDYVNLPLSKEEYLAFVEALLAAEKVTVREFEEPRYFEGCLPIEVMAERGPLCLAHGPMRPVGLTDPRTGQRPFAVVQLRPEDKAQTHWNLVGFQTRLTQPEQQRVFRMLPGLANATFARLGQIHRNTYLEAPKILSPDLSLRAAPHIFVGGQLSGVEGYTESIASGFLAAKALQARLEGKPFEPPPPTTALGAIYHHLRGGPGPFTPSNITFASFPPPEGRVKKMERRAHLTDRARVAFAAWAEGWPLR